MQSLFSNNDADIVRGEFEMKRKAIVGMLLTLLLVSLLSVFSNMSSVMATATIYIARARPRFCREPLEDLKLLQYLSLFLQLSQL